MYSFAVNHTPSSCNSASRIGNMTEYTIPDKWTVPRAIRHSMLLCPSYAPPDPLSVATLHSKKPYSTPEYHTGHSFPLVNSDYKFPCSRFVPAAHADDSRFAASPTYPETPAVVPAFPLISTPYHSCLVVENDHTPPGTDYEETS